MNFQEKACFFECQGEQLLGILAVPDVPAETAVLIVVGGPQYRVGSHRQFVLMARALAASGYASLRFDCRGMGDSPGRSRNFEQISEDIAAAIELLIAGSPVIHKVVLWGLCDAASASLIYWDATQDSRVKGFVLLNPWVRSESTLARTQIKYYYGQRLLNPEFWKNLITCNFQVGRSLREFMASLRLACTPAASNSKSKKGFQDKMVAALNEFPGQKLLILSGHDYTAKEFLTWMAIDQARARLLSHPCMTCINLPDADHTFSSQLWRREIETTTLAWLRKMEEL